MHVLILQPPLVQPNSPYPSGAYLSAFFNAVRNCQLHEPGFVSGFQDFSACEQVETVRWVDVSRLLYTAMFSSRGLAKLFDLVSRKALETVRLAETRLDERQAAYIRLFLTRRDAWIEWADTIQTILGAGGGTLSCAREKCHEFVRSPHVPRGPRALRFLQGCETVCADDALMLATLAVEDLCDFISSVYDPHFEPVRYAASLAQSEGDFSALEQAVDAPVFSDFLAPVLEELFVSLESEYGFLTGNGRWLVCLSVPFPGTVAGALFCGRAVKKSLGSRAVTALGGGYVNTELRGLAERDPDCSLFSYVDTLVYDRGYAPLLDLLSFCKGADRNSGAESGIPRSFLSSLSDSFLRAEQFFTRTLVPDYGDIDFSLYPRMADALNPMHRLWSDGAWIKAYLAHGCYWHQCSFCDTTLDYVKSFCMTDAAALHAGLLAQAKKKNAYGVHFVDEAAPPRLLRDFALSNCEAGSARLTFWGNIRFEKSFTRQNADLLAYGGLTGVTGGVEIAAQDGLGAVKKGIDIETLVCACAAFKEAGILVHAYMIFGYWEETPQMLVDSMETLRQLFVHGLLDSAFWHKFVLTRHSRLYSEWERGLHPGLRPIESGEKNGQGKAFHARFAQNDLRFEGEHKSAKYAQPLDTALDCWMRGENLQVPVRKWFPFQVPSPSIGADFIARHIEAYEKKRDDEISAVCSFLAESGGKAADREAYVEGSSRRCYWLGGLPVLSAEKNGRRFLHWIYMDETCKAAVEASCAQRIADALYGLRPDSGAVRSELYKILAASDFPVRNFAGKGLICV